MSYLQIRIGTLLKDKKGIDIPDSDLRGLKFNQIAKVEYQDITEGIKNPVVHSAALVYAGLYANCIVKRVEPDFTFEDVSDWCDKVTNPNIFMEILEVYKSTLPLIPETEKKKVAKQLPKKSIKRNALK